MIIEVYVSTGLVGSERRETIDTVADWGLDEDASDDEINECAKDWMFETINWGWTEKEPT